MKIIFTLLLVSSCAIMNDMNGFNTPRQTSVPAKIVNNKELWVGKSLEELDLHPVYATLKMENRKTSSGVLVRTYNNKDGAHRALLVKNDTSCNHVFYVSKDEKITDYVRVGSDCTETESELFSPVAK